MKVLYQNQEVELVAVPRFSGAQSQPRPKREMTEIQKAWCRRKGIKIDQPHKPVPAVVYEFRIIDPLVGEFGVRPGDTVQAVLVDDEWFEIKTRADVNYLFELCIEEARGKRP